MSKGKIEVMLVDGKLKEITGTNTSVIIIDIDENGQEIKTPMDFKRQGIRYGKSIKTEG